MSEQPPDAAPDSFADPAAATGHPGVDAAVGRLGELADLPVEDHADVYDDVHQRLQDTLAEADGT